MTPVELAVPEIPVERFELACGARLLVSRRAAAPVTAVEFHLRGGHSLDVPGREGVAYLTGALLDQGTRQRDDEEITELLERAGGGVSGSSTGFAGHIAARDWKQLLELMAEMITTPRYPARNFERQRQRLLDRLVVERDDPRVRGARRFRELVYGDHWLARPEVGTCESVPTVERRDLAAFHRREWRASRSIIAVCGDVKPAEVRRVLDRALGGWKAGSDLGRRSEKFPPLAPRSDVFRVDRQQVHVSFGHLGIRRNEPDFPALLVMDHILGTGPGFTNRIPGKLRDELGLAYSVSANLTGSAGVLPGVFSAYIGTSPQHVGTALSVFCEELRRIQKEAPSDGEVDLAARYVTGSMPLGFERASARARYLIYAERNGLDEQHLPKLLQSVAAVTPEDVRAAAERHLHPQAACVAAAGPLSKSDLRRYLRAAGG